MDKIMEKYKHVLGYTILIIIILMLATCNGKLSNKIDEGILLLEASQDIMEKLIKKNGEQVASIKVLQTENVNTLLNLKTKEKDVLLLQGEVKKYQRKLQAGSSVTVIGTTTSLDITGKTGEIIKYDTIIKDSFIYISPTFPVKYKDDWVNLNGSVDRFSFDFDTLSIKNDFTFALLYKKEKRKKVPYIEVTSKNPYTDVNYLKTYSVSIPPPKRLGLGIFIGYGGYFDPVILRGGSAVIGGIGLNYTIFPIK
jgi:hypothetical protein